MRTEPVKPNSETLWILTCAGASLVLGIVMSQQVDPQGFESFGLSSIIRKSPSNLPVIVAAIVVVVGCVQLTVLIKPSYLFVLGVILAGGALAAPPLAGRFFPHVADQIRTMPSLLPLAVLEFSGATFISIGLLRLARSRGDNT